MFYFRIVGKMSDNELIEKYLAGELSPQEKASFEYRLEDDRELARRLRLRKNFPSLFQANGVDAIIMDQSKPKETPLPEKPRSGCSHKRIARVVIPLIALAALIVLLVFLFTGKKKCIQEPVQQGTLTEKPMPVGIKPAADTPPAVKPSPPDRVENPPAASLPVNLTDPPDRSVLERNQDIVFKWEMTADTFTRFYIISGKGEQLILWRGIPAGTRQIRIDASRLKPGSYVWYVGDRSYSRTIEIR